jgi:TPR repeat protein
MTKRSGLTQTSVAIVGVLAIGIVAGVLRFTSSGDERGLEPPFNSTVTEAIKRARGLQRQGQWELAANELDRYALEGYPVAMFHMAKAYSRGWGIKPDLERARQLLLRAVQYRFDYRGEAAYELGRLFQASDGPNCDSIAVAWFTRALDWDYEKSHVQLALHYERGLGVDQDLDRAARHYRGAVNAGYETASIRFARVLNNGNTNIEADPERAQLLATRSIETLRIKASQGSGGAAKTMGRLYRDGEFVVADSIVAEQWFRRSSQLGDTGGMHDLAVLLLSSANTQRASDEALGWLRRAAGLGHGGAMTALGRLHLNAKHDLKPEGAPAWFTQGVEAGHAGSMAELARLRAEGALVSRDMPGAITLARRGAALGHLGSKTILEDLLAQAGNSSRQS